MNEAKERIKEIRKLVEQLEQDPDEYKKLVRDILFVLASLPEDHTDYATFRMIGRNLQNSYKATLASRVPNFKKGIETVKLHLEYLFDKYID